MFNSNINLFQTLLSHDGWSGDTATGRRRVTSQGWGNTLTVYNARDFPAVVGVFSNNTDE